MPVAALQAAAAKASQVPGLATYPVSQDPGAAKSTIHTDWASFSEGAAISWVADMDVDCDGLDSGCQGNPDGQPQTNWGALAAYEVPFIVIPDKYLNGKMFYGILGDSNGDSPQVTGEASWLMARTCFPNEGLNGNNGHTSVDVTYIVFTGKDAVLPGSALTKNYITNFTTLRSWATSLSTRWRPTWALREPRPQRRPQRSQRLLLPAPGQDTAWGHLARPMMIARTTWFARAVPALLHRLLSWQ
ncbi:hypothetical protein CNMCM5793_006658 [Aspergillus hiratsukae]|uniref:Endo-chitosanase n=1 Tax=Aspergillus hiratsukae TaxID=1194566 RepID=A0A8H6PIB7_9EURO|nr:hypothetical protein CNMCM5793_006658 [Aspergillus hiratsukae]